jgi:hypothetical protein
MGIKRVNILNIIVPVLILLVTMIVSLIEYPSVFEKSKLTVITVFVAVIIYVIVWIYLKPDKFSRNGGLTIGLLFIINISIEEFISWQSKTGSLVSTLIMMFLIFITFSFISAIKAINTGSIKPGLKSSFVSALLGTIIALCFGFLINYLFPHRMVFVLRGYPGYTDFANPRAFTFFNAFDNASNHVIIAPIISILMGSIGALIPLSILRLRKRRLN